jgi:hypothetical protein
MLGGIGIGLVWGWLLAGFRPPAPRHWTFIAAALAATSVAGVTVYFQAKLQGLLAFTIASGISVAARVSFMRAIARHLENN